MSDHLVRLLDPIARTRVMCVGDVMLDRFVYGAVERISPEAPIPVLRVVREHAMAGGAGNVAANLTGLGAAVHFLTVVGDDEAGAELRGLIRQAIGNDDGIVVEPRRPTTQKSRFLAGGQQLLRADRETAGPITEATEAALLAAVDAAIGDCGAVILSDYGKGVLSGHVIAGIIAHAGKAGVPVVVDPKGSDYRRYRGAAVLTPNRKELAQATGLPVATDAEVAAAAGALLERCGVGAVIATRSEQGMSVIEPGRPPHHLPAEAREVFDVSGAGDTVAAVLSAALAAGATLVEAAQLANAAAGIVVGKVGTAVVRGSELLAALHQAEWRRGEAKVATLAEAVDRVRRWRQRGQRVGFTNGCFDLLHPGHLSLLNQSRAACDRLVVGLNSDDSVRRLKGPTRPVQGEAARAQVLASLEAVDLVVTFDEDTPLTLIESLHPDVLVKGADYRIDQVVGADVVQSYGGKVVLAELVAGQSTTATIARLNGKVG